MAKEKVIVTGGAGFIGSNLVRMLLAEGFHAIVIDDLSSGTLGNVPKGAEFIKKDICSPDIYKHFEGVSTVFHMAARNCLPDCSAMPVDTSYVNVMGTSNVLNAAVRAKVSNFIYSDTSAEYEGIDQFPSKVDRIKPESVYACSKRGGALAAEAFHNLHGLTVTFVRYFNVYGPAQDWRRVVPPVMSAFTTKLLSKESPTIYGNGKKRRDFIHVDDVNSFHLMLLKNPAIRGKTYNLGSGKDYTIYEIYEQLEKIIKSGMKPIFKPDQPTEAERTLADISETVKAGWRPKMDLQAGLQAFVEYMRPRLDEVRRTPLRTLGTSKLLPFKPKKPAKKAMPKRKAPAKRSKR